MTKLHISDDVTLDLAKLVDSRMLINANSGGGKSWLLRRIAEEAHGHVQTVILDWEGEFATLREKYDYLLIGSGGEVQTTVRAAELLARRLMEMRASAIIDLSDLKINERRLMVRLFCEALVTLPKSLWHPALFLVDEAHQLCPERSAGEAESTGAVIDLMSLGRKRGYAGILATQRLSKLHKDAEAEANNVAIGRTVLDIDQTRAAKLLGIAASKQAELRDLEPGEFYAYGPAFSTKGVFRFRPNAVQTTHPKPGQRHKFTPPKPSDAVSRLVEDLKDLPEQAEAEIRDIAEAKRKINELERELRKRPTETKVETKTEYVEVPVLKNGQLDRTLKIAEKVEAIAAKAGEQQQALIGSVAELRRLIAPAAKPHPVAASPRPVQERKAVAPRPKASVQHHSNGDGLDAAQQRILDTIATLNLRGIDANRESVARWMAIHPNGGRYGSNLARLRELGYLDGFELTEAGRAAATASDTGPDAVLAALPDEGHRRVFKEILDAGETLTRETLAERLGIHPNGGRYGSTLGWLRAMGVIPERGDIKLTPGALA